MEISTLNLSYSGNQLPKHLLRCWNDEEFTTEQAAYGIAFLIVRELTDLTVIERSRKARRGEAPPGRLYGKVRDLITG